MFNFQKEKDGYGLFFLGNVMSGSTAGVLSLFFYTTIDGLLDDYKKPLAAEGIAGFYHRFVITAVGVVIYRGLYFGLFDSVKPLMPSSLENNFFATFLLGWGVTIIAGFASYPIDTIRRRLMITSVKNASSIDCAKQILVKEGVKAYFKGATSFFRVAIPGAGALSGYDKLQYMLIG